ncbi:MAG: hypothetical protein FJ145_01870 [Deltaproteobacteria bacterium]|nr:hypothetical protein [Deltaproteobacteria bacterium]
MASAKRPPGNKNQSAKNASPTTQPTEQPAANSAQGLSRFIWPLLAVVTLVLHLWALDIAPPGAYVDETSIGYNAYSILRTGADEHGVSFPLYFKAFGEYKNPVFIYTLVPLIGVFDLSVWTIRLGAALFGLGTALLLGLIVKEDSNSSLSWMVGFVIAGLTPWLFTLSRVSFEVISFPFFIALAWWCWLRGIKSAAIAWFFVCGLAWGVAIFTYSTARLMAPVIVLALLISYYREIKEQRFRPLIAAVPFGLCLLLLATWMIQHPGALTARFADISIARDSHDSLIWMGRFIGNYLTYLSPQFLFLNGDTNLRHHTGFGGELFLVAFPAVIAGLAHIWQNRSRANVRFVLAGFLLFPLAASLTADSAHSLRTANVIPFVVVMVAWGILYLRALIGAQRVLAALLVLVAALEAGGFFVDYFFSYPERARAWFNAGLPEAIKISLQRDPSQSELHYSMQAFRDENFESTVPDIQPYMQFLFFGKLDPKTYQQKGMAGFRIYPLKPDTNLPSKSVLLVKNGEEVFSASGKGLVLANSDMPPPAAQPVSQIVLDAPRLRNPPAYQIFQVP